MVSSSSTKKAARLAQKGRGKKVRFQGGTLFPLVVMAIVVAGMALIVYARFSRPAADASPPTVDDHWHVAYGFDLCGTESVQRLTGAKEELDSTGQILSQEYLRTGVHSHDDGVIHWHPLTSAATGHNATLGVFLDVYGVDLSDTELSFPDDQLGGEEYVEGETMCGDEEGKLAVGVWNNFTDTGDPTVYTADFDSIRINRDAMVFVVAYIPESQDAREVAMPPWAAELPALGALDQAPGASGLPPTTTTAGATGATSDVTTDVTTGASTATSGSAPDASTPATDVPAATVPPTTGG